MQPRAFLKVEVCRPRWEDDASTDECAFELGVVDEVAEAAGSSNDETAATAEFSGIEVVEAVGSSADEDPGRMSVADDSSCHWNEQYCECTFRCWKF